MNEQFLSFETLAGLVPEAKDDPDHYQRLLAAACDWTNTYCQRRFLYAAIDGETGRLANGFYFPLRSPIVSVERAVVGGVEADYQQMEACLDFTASLGLSNADIVLSYTGGYQLDAVPEDVKVAVCLLVTKLSGLLLVGPVDSIASGGQNYQFSYDALRAVRELLARHRRAVV